MDQHDDLNRALLAQLLESALVDFEDALRDETPGLSKTEMTRYMRAARKFASHLIGSKPRTRGRQSRGGGSSARSK
jgi:hypothetical protein